MAFRSRRGTRTSPRRRTSRVRRSTTRRRTGVRSGRGGVHTVRVVVQQAPAPSLGPVLNGETGNLGVPVSPRKAKF